MKINELSRMPAGIASGRFFLVAHLPTYAAATYLLVLCWAGAPGADPRFKDAWRTAAALGAGEILLLLIAVTLSALVLHPLQLPLVRLLEGFWPRWCGALTRVGLGRQRRNLRRYRRAAELSRDTPPDAEGIRRAGLADTEVRRRFPARDELLRPTRLGNALAALEDRAGAPYGWDAPVAWPRLYPLLGPQVRAVVDDRRDLLDAMCRLAATAAVCAVASAALLARAHWWVALSAVPLGLAWLAYRSAVHAAYSYAEAVRLAFDLERFALYPALHMERPADLTAERALNEELSTFWRQGKDPSQAYTHPTETAGVNETG